LKGPAFDVVMAADGVRAVDAGTELIPCSAVESFFKTTLQREEMLSLLIGRGKELGAKMWLMAPPPPLPGPAVRERLEKEPHFAARLAEIGLTGADVSLVAEPVRVRLHTLLLGVYRRFAEERGAGFCPPPARVVDESGLLRAQFWGTDITHGSADFGAAYLEEIVGTAVASDA
jgi:hypothetical protein